MAVECNQTAVNSIKKFYDGAEVFITGGSGFVGRVLIEKLLRSCEGISKIYLLMRAKKGVEARDRIHKMTDCMLFEKVKAANASSLDKLEVVEGDMMDLRLGISEASLMKLRSCTHIFHCAASVRFDDPLKDAILMNTRGTREICQLAMEMPHLKAFVHVSTTFIQPKTYTADEVFYPADFEWQKFIAMAEKFDHDTMNCLMMKLTKFAPNTYTFTKHLAEQVCKQFRDQSKLPIVIYRPSIIINTEIEPFTGWIDNLNGPMTLLLSGCFGILQVLSKVAACRLMDSVPADVVARGLIITAWKTWKDQALVEPLEIPVYNAARIQLMTYGATRSLRVLHDYPPELAIMYCATVFTTCTPYSWLIRIVESIIPAIILDTILKLSGSKPKILKLQRLTYCAEQSLAHFTAKDFHFTNTKFLDLEKEVPESESDDFYLRKKCIPNFIDFIDESFKTMLQVLFHQDFKNIEKARKRYKKVLLISRGYQIFMYSVLTWLLVKYLSFLTCKML